MLLKLMAITTYLVRSTAAIDSIQILTAPSGIVKLVTSAYLPKASPWEDRLLQIQGSPRVTSFTTPQDKAVNICFITPLPLILSVYTTPLFIKSIVTQLYVRGHQSSNKNCKILR